MNTTNKSRSAVFGVESNSEDMRLLHRKQREAWLANGIPNYATRIDRMDRLIALLVDNKDEIVATISEDYGNRCIEESLFAEVLYLVDSLKFNKVHLGEWMKPEFHYAGGIARVEISAKGSDWSY